MREMTPDEYYLRTGRRLPPPDPIEKKFNPWHDSEDGKFTFEGGGGYFGSGRTGASGTSRPRTGTFRQNQAGRVSRSPPVDPIGQLSKPNRPPFPGQDAASPSRTSRATLRRFRTESVPDRLVQQFRGHVTPEEGDRNDVYRDSKGIATVGIGHKVVAGDNLKVGDRISDARKEALWKQDSVEALAATLEQLDEAGISDPAFVMPLASVNFQLGPGWKQEHKKTWMFIMKGDYRAAAHEAQKSDWYNDSPGRVQAFQNALLALRPRRSP